MIRKLPETLITLIMRLGGKISNFTKNSKIELNAKSQIIDLKGCSKTSRVLFWFLSKKLLRKQKWLKTPKSLFSGAKWKNLPKSGHISLYSEDYWSKNHFPSACQILYNFDSVTLDVPRKPWWSVSVSPIGTRLNTLTPTMLNIWY